MSCVSGVVRTSVAPKPPVLRKRGVKVSRPDLLPANTLKQSGFHGPRKEFKALVVYLLRGVQNMFLALAHRFACLLRPLRKRSEG